MTTKHFLIATITLLFMAVMACGGGEDANDIDSDNQSKSENTEKESSIEDGKGIGPISNVALPAEIDEQMALRGEEVFEAKCTACHEFDNKYVGPSLAGVTNSREPEWIMNMILNPEEMTKKDPIAKALFEEYLTQMTFQDVTEEDARAMLEYFRKYDKEN